MMLPMQSARFAMQSAMQLSDSRSSVHKCVIALRRVNSYHCRNGHTSGNGLETGEGRGRPKPHGEGSIKDVRDAQVPRAELERVWSAYDQRLADHQRQLDESKQAAGSVYGARDVILDLRERLDRVERQRLTQP